MPDFPQLFLNRRHQPLSIWLSLCALAALFLLAGCQSQGQLRTSTDNTRTPGADFNGRPVEIGLSELALNPQSQRGQFLRVSGQFQPAEPLTCGSHIRGPLQRWAIVNDEWQLDAVGFEQVVRYFPPGEEMTVEGVFRSYTGRLGCGKGAPTETIWYLDVLRIISPNPLTVMNNRIITVSEGDLTAIPEETTDPTVTIEETETGTPSATPTPTLAGTTPAASPSPTPTLPASASATPTSTAESGVTPFPTPTAGTPPGTILPSPMASPSPTPTTEGYPPPPPVVPTNTPPPGGYP